VNEVAAAYDHCEALTRRAASNFYWGFRLLPPERRRALSAVYAFCRSADDIADEPGMAADPRRLLDAWRDELERVHAGRPRRPIGVALADAVHRFGIPREHFDAIVAGVEMDLSRDRYERWEGDLERYCYAVASAVGLIAIEIFGYRNPSARDYAVQLGLAFQLTNILRDVGEDAARGRVYLPREDLERFGCTATSAGFEGPIELVIAFEAERGLGRLRAGLELVPLIDRRCGSCVLAMAGKYRRLLERFAAEPSLVLRGRLSLRPWEKGLVLARSLTGTVA